MASGLLGRPGDGPRSMTPEQHRARAEQWESAARVELDPDDAAMFRRIASNHRVAAEQKEKADVAGS